MSGVDQLEIQVHLANTKVNQAAAALKERAAQWEPRPCPKGWRR